MKLAHFFFSGLLILTLTGNVSAFCLSGDYDCAIRELNDITSEIQHLKQLQSENNLATARKEWEKKVQLTNEYFRLKAQQRAEEESRKKELEKLQQQIQELQKEQQSLEEMNKKNKLESSQQKTQSVQETTTKQSSQKEQVSKKGYFGTITMQSNPHVSIVNGNMIEIRMEVTNVGDKVWSTWGDWKDAQTKERIVVLKKNSPTDINQTINYGETAIFIKQISFPNTGKYIVKLSPSFGDHEIKITDIFGNGNIFWSVVVSSRYY